MRLVQAVGSHLGPAQGREVTADAERVAEVAGEGPDVGAGGAFHSDVDVDRLAVAHRAQPVDLKAVDGDRTCGQRDLFAGPDARVGAFAVDLDRADAAGNLLDVPGEGGDAGPDLVLGDPGGAVGGSDVALGVVGDGRFAEADGGRVRLGGPHDVGQQPGGLVDADHQHARGHRVQGPGVAHFSGTGEPPHPSNHIVAGPALGFVHYYQSRKHASQYICARPRPRARTARRLGWQTCPS